MEVEFTSVEIRLLGCLIEKESTTPETYPLTLNSLTRACNQKSNREPVTDFSEMQVQEALDGLAKKMLVSRRSGSDSRVIKYSHRLKDRLTPEFDFDQAELAVISVLLVRGPQTLGEIRTRSSRIHKFDDMQALIAALTRLGERDDGPYVKQLPRHPGQKESRYTHLFAGDVEDTPQSTYQSPRVGAAIESDQHREGLEQRVRNLEEELSSLQEEFHAFVKQFE